MKVTGKFLTGLPVLSNGVVLLYIDNAAAFRGFGFPHVLQSCWRASSPDCSCGGSKDRWASCFQTPAEGLSCLLVAGWCLGKHWWQQQRHKLTGTRVCSVLISAQPHSFRCGSAGSHVSGFCLWLSLETYLVYAWHPGTYICYYFWHFLLHFCFLAVYFGFIFYITIGHYFSCYFGMDLCWFMNIVLSLITSTT